MVILSSISRVEVGVGEIAGGVVSPAPEFSASCASVGSVTVKEKDFIGLVMLRVSENMLNSADECTRSSVEN